MKFRQGETIFYFQYIFMEERSLSYYLYSCSTQNTTRQPCHHSPIHDHVVWKHGLVACFSTKLCVRAGSSLVRCLCASGPAGSHKVVILVGFWAPAPAFVSLG